VKGQFQTPGNHGFQKSETVLSPVKQFNWLLEYSSLRLGDVIFRN